MIDPETRDIVQDMKVNEVYAEDGRLRTRTLEVIPQVKDPCKEQKVGRCAERGRAQREPKHRARRGEV
jgi:hypothetical protein